MAVTIYTRLWNIPGTLEFLGDQGRDARRVAAIYQDFNPAFIGPVTSVGNMYLGPLYYYFMTPFLILTYPSPVGPAYGVALLAILTVGLTIKLGQTLVGRRASILAATMLTFSATAITYSRFSWNPNPAPLFGLLMAYGSSLAWKKDHRYWLLVAGSFAVLIQLHYLTLISAAGAGLIWLAHCFQIKKKQATTTPRQMISVSIISVLLVLFSLTPLMLFDFKHNWLNVNAFHGLVFKETNFRDDQSPWYQSVARSLRETHGRSLHVIAEYSFGQNRNLNQVLVIAVLVTLGVILIKDRDHKTWPGAVVLSAYLLTGILGVAFYRGSLFDHYLTYLFPIVFLVWGLVFDRWLRFHFLSWIPVLVILGLFINYNLPRIDLETRSWGITQMEDVAKSISEHIDEGEAFTIVLLSGTGDLHGENYRYFLETLGFAPLGFESINQVETLIIINEDQPNFDPESTKIHEIKVFPSQTIDKEYTIEDGPTITILR